MKKKIKSIGKGCLVGCLVVFVLFIIFNIIVLYPIIFPPSPEKIAKIEAQRKKERIKEIKEEINAKKIDDYITEYNIKPNNKNPEFDVLMNEFNNQKDRLVFDKCNFSYNNKIFFLGDSITKIKAVLGKPYEIEKTMTYRYPRGEIKFFERPFTDSKFIKGSLIEEIKLRLSIYEYPDSSRNGNEIVSKVGANNSSTLKEFEQVRTVELKKLKDRYKDSLIEISDELFLEYDSLKINTVFKRDIQSQRYFLKTLKIDLRSTGYYAGSKRTYDVIKFRGIPYDLSADMYEFLDFSSLRRKDLDNHRIYMFNNDCFFSENTFVYTKIESKPYFETSGGGHLTWTGPYNPNKSRLIDYIRFSAETLEDLKLMDIEKAMSRERLSDY